MFRLSRLMLPAVLVASLCSGAQAGTLTQVFSRAGLGDSLDWGQLGGAFTNVASGTAATSVGGLGVTISNSPDLLRLDEGNGWGGHFTLGDHLMFTDYAPGPITLDFGATISGITFQTNSNDYGSFSAHLEAFAGLSDLGGFDVTGFGGGAGSTGDAPILGLTDNVTEIPEVVIPYIIFRVGLAVSQPTQAAEAHPVP